jgi:hypothetical protein
VAGGGLGALEIAVLGLLLVLAQSRRRGG